MIAFFRRIIFSTYSVCLTLFRIIIPLSFAVKLLEDLGFVALVGRVLEPLMALVGLPGSMGLVWATGMLTNLYGGIAIFANLAPKLELSVAQATVLGTMMLVAHALPVEVSIAKKAGVSFKASLLIRVLGALLYGLILNQVYSAFGLLQQAAKIDFVPSVKDPSWMAWFSTELERSMMIVLIIFSLILMIETFKLIRLDRFFSFCLKPLLSVLRISDQACQLVIIGMLMGISYGGGLIIKESQDGALTRKDCVLSLVLLSLCHSVIEDTCLMLLIGGHLSGLLWGRMLLTLVFMFFFARLIDRLPAERFSKLFLA